MKEQLHADLAEDGEGFLSRWSRRKHEASDASEEVHEPAMAIEPEPPPLTDADMPPIDSLDEGSDYSGFFSPGVSEELRQLALRKLFRSAAFNLRDGLDDYDDDFTTFAKLGDIVTREMRVRQAIDAAREKAKAALAEAGESAPPATQSSGQDGALASQDDETETDPETACEEASHEQPSQPA